MRVGYVTVHLPPIHVVHGTAPREGERSTGPATTQRTAQCGVRDEQESKSPLCSCHAPPAPPVGTDCSPAAIRFCGF